MKTEKEKMIQGEAYNPEDAELKEERKEGHEKAHMYNQIGDESARNDMLQQIFGTVDESAHVELGLRVDYGTNIHVGKNFYANFNSVFLDVAPITIGDNAFIGTNVSFVTPSHPINPVKRNARFESGRPITIGNNVWVGTAATILGGVTLGDNVVVGAGAVVTKSFEDNVVIAGNPAQVIRKIEIEE